MNILSLDATTIANKIRTGELSSLEVTEAYIKHIERVNPYINAVVQTRFDEARREAKEKDQQLKEGKNEGKLFGVPISVKESFFVEGMTTTGGVPSRKGCVDPNDADVVKRLKDEGAIILGKTNTPPLLLCSETDNTVYGQTNNPWDHSRTAGGSSGGEGALIAAGGAAVGIGSDIGGSIRFPAHFNGVIGFKSGKQQVSDQGHFPPFSSPYKRDMQGIGPIAKSVDDARLVYEIIALNPIQEQDITQFDFIFPETDLHQLLSPVMKEKVSSVQSELVKTSLSVKHGILPYFDEAVSLWLGVMTYGGMKEEREIVEVLKDEDLYQKELHPYFIGIIELAKSLQPTEVEAQQIFDQRLKVEKLVNEYLQNKVIILPVYHKTAPKHSGLVVEALSTYESILKYMRFTAYANAFGLPSLVIPIGEEEGMPFAIQLITAIGQEDALFRTGKIIESSFRGYKKCTNWDTDRRELHDIGQF